VLVLSVVIVALLLNAVKLQQSFVIKTTMTQCGITPSELETLAMDRTGWRSTCKSAIEEFEVWHTSELEAKRDLRKSGPPSTSNFECQICHRMCRSWIGLLAHNKSHSWWWDPSYWRLSPWYACFGLTSYLWQEFNM